MVENNYCKQQKNKDGFFVRVGVGAQNPEEINWSTFHEKMLGDDQQSNF